jgi:predicted RNA-binding Zn ribbon-like protein
MTGENENENAMDPQPGGRAPAPGELALIQRFLNTRWNLRDEHGGEVFASPRALADWLASQGLIDPGARLEQADVERALAVREGLRALAFANNGRQLDQGAVDAMRKAARGAATGIDIDRDGPHFVVSAATGLNAAIGALYAITARAMLEGSWTKLKACPGRHCGWVFYDQSRNQSARWCSMKVCGDREKSRAYYRRKTEGKGLTAVR